MNTWTNRHRTKTTISGMVEDCFFCIVVSFPCKTSLHSLPSLYLHSKNMSISIFINLVVQKRPLSTSQSEIKWQEKRIQKTSVMEIKVQGGESHEQVEEKVPLLLDLPVSDPENKSLVQKAISQTFQSTAHLANLLPTGTVLAFQLLSPIFTNQGKCDSVCRSMTSGLIVLCGLSCFLTSFTDSLRDKNGNVCYGLATFNGLWVIDGSVTLPPELAERYRVRFIDFMHAFMSILVFAAVALFDQNVVSCFYPKPSAKAQEFLTAMPVGIGVFCSMLFVVFPTTRHGIGFPVSAN